ncbi:MAG: hypothetical protein ACRD2A_02165, partial [Vicinamibacterales bacterium]
MTIGAACGRSEPGAGGATATPTTAAKETYPEPRWPAYFKPAKTVDDLMPAARQLARNRSGLQGNGMGILKEGESVLIVVNNDDADPMVLEAIDRALKERKIAPHIKFRSELLGKTRAQVAREQGDEGAGRRIEDAGIYQASAWVDGQFPNPAEPKAWLKKRRPELYAELFPGDKSPVGAGPGMSEGPSAGGEGGTARQGEQYRNRNAVGDAIKKYLTSHPEIRGVFWGGGGSTGLRRQLYPMSDKFLGLFVQDNIYNLQSPMSSYPGDVWQLAEEQLLEPLVYVDRMEAKDPEGIDVYADLTEEMAQKWAQGAY